MKSHINTAKFTKRIPTEQFAYEEYSLEAAIDASESGEDVLIEMRRQVSSAFAADLVESTENKEQIKAAKKAAKKEKKKNGKTNPAIDEDEDGEDGAEAAEGDGEGAEDDEAADDSSGDGGDDSAEGDEGDDAGDDQGEESEDDGEGEDDSDKKPGKKGKPSADKKVEGKKTFKKKPQVYNRSIDQHREIFSRVLRSVKADWKESDTLKARAKKISEQLDGEKFLDETGEVLPDFKAEVKKRLLVKGK